MTLCTPFEQTGGLLILDIKILRDPPMFPRFWHRTADTSDLSDPGVRAKARVACVSRADSL